MKNILIAVILLFISLRGVCNQQSFKGYLYYSEKPDSITLSDFDIWFNQIQYLTFQPKLFQSLDTATAFLTRNHFEFSIIESEEFSEKTIIIVLISRDKLHYAELNYVYEYVSVSFLNFRNIITKTDNFHRNHIVQMLSLMAESETDILPRKYKTNYGEEGLVYSDFQSKTPEQIIVQSTGGVTDWIEIRKCNYWFVKETDLKE